MLSVARWALIVLLSIVIMLPPIWAISSWAVERAEAQYRATRPKAPPAQKDFGFGLRGLEALVIYTAGSFVVLWPLSLWASYRLLRNLGQRRRQQAPKPLTTVQHSDLVIATPQTLGESVPGANSAEDRDDRPVVAGAELPLDDAALGSVGDRR